MTMISDDDLRILKAIDINSVSELVSGAAEFERVHATSRALSDKEIAHLRGAGVELEDDESSPLLRKALEKTALEYEQIIATSYSRPAAASLLGVSIDQIEQMVSSKRIYSISRPEDKVFPGWQFQNDSLVFGISELIKQIPSNAHPVEIFRFFCTSKVDLEDTEDGEVVKLSPIEWLNKGYPAKEIEPLLRDM